ncbi:MAG: hypothetical protein NTV51_14325 [Verrucomicrobia bacterium]|nr:hypothetical protein [Verrucomicrobiota bacterium]
MGFFDRFTSRKPEPAPAPINGSEATAPAPAPAAPLAGGVTAHLAAARAKLGAKDLPGAVALYEELLASAGDRPDVLVAMSGDLGSYGHVAEIIELVAPRYDADRHGPATGLNLLQAYLAVRNPDAAQHVLDLLFALNRPELEQRLYGFSNAIAEMIATPHAAPPPGVVGGPMPGADAPKVALISISKPIWFYGLEPMAAQLLPPKEGRLRRIAFAQLALPGYPDIAAALKKPEDELGRLSRALPLWLAEAFYFSPSYAPIAAVAVMTPPDGTPNHPMIFGAEWTTENLRQLVDTSGDGLDYIVTGALRNQAGDYEVLLRVWEVKTYRERKTFTARWTPATADEALAKLHGEVRAYMEWSPASAAFAYVPSAKPRAWLDTLGGSLGLFLVEKSILPLTALNPPAELLAHAAQHAPSGEAPSFAFLTTRARIAQLDPATDVSGDVALTRSPLVNDAKKIFG